MIQQQFPTPLESRAELFRACGVTAAACDPCEASNQFREIPFTSSGDAPQNVNDHYPFQLGQKMYSPRRIADNSEHYCFCVTDVTDPQESKGQQITVLFLTR
jgi:hypothetical protein